MSVTEKKTTIAEFLMAKSKGTACSITEGDKTYMTLGGAIWAIDNFGNEYFPVKDEDGKAFFMKTHDKFKGVHNEVVL